MLRLEFRDRGCILTAEAPSFALACSILLGQFAERYPETGQCIDVLIGLAKLAGMADATPLDIASEIKLEFEADDVDDFTLSLRDITYYSIKLYDPMEVVNGKLFVDSREFVLVEPDESPFGVDADGKLVTLFRGHLQNHWDRTDIKGYFKT